MSASLQIGPFSLPWGLVILMLAWLVADVLLARWARKRGQSTTPHAWLLPLLALVAARLGFVARYADEYLAQPLSMLNVRDGGWEPWAALAVQRVIQRDGLLAQVKQRGLALPHPRRIG